MRVADFDFHLPPHLIAQSPPPVRGDSRMLLLNRRTGALADHHFTDLPQLLQPGDLLVLNDSRVIPARLFAHRLGLHTQKSSQSPSALVEVLLTEQLDTPHTWSALVRPAKKVPAGETLLFPDPSGHPPLRAQVTAEGPFGQRTLHFLDAPDLFAALDRIGHLPLPPYIHRTRTQPNTPQDRERYQTVLSSAATRGSAAAPTAGLHFTPQVLAALTDRGVHLATVTLHVGLGTFQPVRVEHLADIRLHAEPYTLPATTADALNLATRKGRRILAVGTTTTRTLEHVARTQTPGQLTPHTGSTALFLSPGSPFHLVQGLLTNFHLPQSTLLMLVSAFAGREPTLHAYAHAIAHHYRFFSYGDCMLLL